jgi:SHS2 domain-containing protein
VSELATGFVAGFASAPGDIAPTDQPFVIDLGEPSGLEDTIVALLEEILFIVETEEEVPVRTEVASLSPGHIEGHFSVIPVELLEETGAVPKAVSYSDLAIEESEGGLWKIRVTIDV